MIPAQLRSETPLPHPNELLHKDLMAKIQTRFARDFELWNSVMAS